MVLDRLAVALLVSVLLASSLSDASAQGRKRAGSRAGRGTCTACLNTATPSTLTAADIATLRHMYEEEKLALNFYQTAYTQWKLPALSNIAAAEQKHRDAIAKQISLHNVAASDIIAAPAGVFVEAALQSLYNELIAQSAVSVVAALNGAGLIEETDIIDLKNAIAATAAPELKTVYGNLKRGSENHLRSVVRQLSAQGVTYSAQILTAQELSAITASSAARRGNGLRKGQGKRQGNGQRKARDPSPAPGYKNGTDLVLNNSPRMWQGPSSGPLPHAMYDGTLHTEW